MGRSDWTSKAARVRALERVLADPSSSSYTVMEATKELRRLTSSSSRRRSPDVVARVREWYAGEAPGVWPPVPPSGADLVEWEREVCSAAGVRVQEVETVRLKALAAVVYRDCCKGACVCGEWSHLWEDDDEATRNVD